MESVNYFKVIQAMDMGQGFVMLVLDHEYGEGPPVRIPVSGSPEWFPEGCRIELSANNVSKPTSAPA